MDWVLDCSFAAALCLAIESSTDVRLFMADLHPDDALWVPQLWWYEMAFLLTEAERRNQLRSEDVQRILFLFTQLDMNTDCSTGLKYYNRICNLARNHTLPVNEATYLELALRKNICLASLSEQLLSVAEKLRIRIPPERLE
ncbi:type II toxin-antitoxin system VapC family toxin [candidate division CSSED10-310 bacterium]|uniref:Type II toxin-antitoxin system VapC family toxin n=1 Tax=candidate division CSSED10-310 bacterium TaxID=2855610 RepID=A0ABV6Z2S1_UNCC1